MDSLTVFEILNPELMKSKQFFELLVDDLTELEMTDLLEACSAIIERNSWKELRNQTFVDSDKVDDLEWQNSKLEEEKDELDSHLDDLKSDANKALKALEENKIDTAKQILSSI